MLRMKDRFRALAESPRHFVFVMDDKKRLEYASAGVHENLRPQETPLLHWALDTTFASGEPRVFEEHREAAQGRVLLETELIPIGSNTGSTSHVLGVTRDITRLKNALDGQRRSRHLFETFRDGSFDCVCDLDTSGRVRYMNPAGLALTGRSLDETVGQPLAALMGRKYASLIRERVERSKKGLPVWLFCELRSALGLRSVESAIVPVLDDRGDTTDLIWIAKDVTDARTTQKELRIASAVISTIREGVICFTGDKVHGWNRAALTLFGFSEEAKASIRPNMLIVSEDREAFEIVWKKACAGKRTEFQTARPLPNGTRVAIGINLTPVKDENGGVLVVAVIARQTDS